MSKLIINFTGGLGNQLFQYSCGMYLQKKYKLLLESNTDDLFKQPHSFYLKNLNLTECNIIIKFLLKILKFFKIKSFLILNLFLENVTFQYQKLERFKKINFIYGYWQSEKYFFKIKREIVAKLDTTLFKKKNVINNKKDIYILLHIRRKDYLSKKSNLEFYHKQPLRYYLKAINFFRNYLKGNFKIILFTDDVRWARNRLSFLDKIIFDYKKDPVSTLYSMKNCNHFIIANSTFSWWAAYLSKSNNKKVVMPKQWFNHKKINSLNNYKVKFWKQI